MHVIDVNEFTVTTGLYRGDTYAFVTHRPSGNQWVAKQPFDGEPANLGMLALGIECGYITFYPKRIIASCDARFFERIEKKDTPPMARSEFDSLCFIGD